MSIMYKFKAKVGGFCYRFRFLIIGLFLLLFIGVAIMQAHMMITFTEQEESEIDRVFPRESLIVIYNNQDEERIASIINQLNNSNYNIRSINAFVNSPIGMPLSAAAIEVGLSMPAEIVNFVFEQNNANLMSMYDFVMAVNSITPGLIPDDQINQMIAGRGQLIGVNYSRMILEIGYFADSDEMNNFLDSFHTILEDTLSTNFYFVGGSALSRELRGTFDFEYLIISLVLSVGLYLVMLISYRRFLLPLILIAIVQTAMWIMMSVMMINGIPIYFLALLIVQSVIKGSALEWGVLLTNSYIEARRTSNQKAALTDAIKKSGRVTMTSSLIMVVVTFTLGSILSGAVASIMMGMGIASLAAAILTIFALPSLLVVFDRFVVKKEQTVN